MLTTCVISEEYLFCSGPLKIQHARRVPYLLNIQFALSLMEYSLKQLLIERFLFDNVIHPYL